MSRKLSSILFACLGCVLAWQTVPPRTESNHDNAAAEPSRSDQLRAVTAPTAADAESALTPKAATVTNYRAELPTTPPSVHALVRGDTLTLDDPEGGTLALAVLDVSEARGFKRITLRGQGLASQITVRGDRVMATIATPRGSYRADDLGDPTTWVAQRVLDQRIDRNVEDFRYAPVS